MKNRLCVLPISLIIFTNVAYSAPPPITATPNVANPTIAYGESKTGQLTIKYNDEDYNDASVVIEKSGIAWKWQSKEHAFEITKVTDIRGRPVNFPLTMQDGSDSIYITYTMKPTTAESTNNEIEIKYKFNGNVQELSIPINVTAVCVNSDYNNQQCNPDIWTCQIDRNLYPVLRVERQANDNSSQDAVRAHNRTHRLASREYSIPFLQFLSVGGIDVRPAPSCGLDPVKFIKNPRASKVANFTWAQNATTKIPKLETETIVNGVFINKITVELPDLITGFSAVNGSTAEYRFDVNDAPTITIEEGAVNRREVFSGKIECILADGTFSVIRNTDPLANDTNAEPPKMHLIIEKP